MSGEIALGWRLATTTVGPGRRRSLLIGLAAAAGTTVVLAVLAVGHADRALHPERYQDGGMDRVLAAIVAVIGLQAAALAATAGRLAASLRARRLGNLRLLGVSASRTRLIAAVETGVAALAGALAGLALFEVVRPLLARLRVAGATWTSAALDPGWSGRVGTFVAVVGLTVALAALPERLTALSALGGARGVVGRRPAWWRVVPLLVGGALCAYFRANRWTEHQVGLLLAAVVLTGIGVIAVVPVFVRLVADALVGVGRGGMTTVAGRRLQAQPTSMNRVVTGLLLGLFLVTGARLVVVAFESTPQYEGAATQVEDRQLVTATVPAAVLDDRIALARATPGVDDVVAAAQLWSRDCAAGMERLCTTGLVLSCADLQRWLPSAHGCRGDAVQELWDPEYHDGAPAPVAGTTTWSAHDPSLDPDGPAVTLPAAADPIVVDRGESNATLAVIVPPALAGVATLLSSGPDSYVVVTGDPGRGLGERLTAAGFVEGPFAPYDPADYDFVASLRAIVLAVGLVVMAVGLLAFAVAAIDRAMQRRADAVGLQLVGVPGAVLRRVQWIEAAVPIVGGSALAIGAGLLAGAAYLGVDDLPLPWRSIAGLAGGAAVGGLLVAGLTVAAANPRIDADAIRRE